MSNSLTALNMESPRDLERDASAFGGLFQQIMNEMKITSPLWEDLTTKSMKLHACLRATIQAVSAFLDAFQKVADSATATKGATKDIGTALTRLCLRHKAVESKLKSFTTSFSDCFIIPLQERLEEWKKSTTQLDKEHSKEYKKARAELKKRSQDTIRLQKKVRKGNLNNGGLSNSFTGGTLPRSGGGTNFHTTPMTSTGNGDNYNILGNKNDPNRILEIALRETVEKKQAFEDAEKHAIRTALIEERSRFCLFVSFLKPVLDEEISMMSELTHVQEAMQQLEKHASDPFALPPASEQVIQDLKGSCDSGTWSFQTPPSSPSSLGSRKSSMCSISSANSSSGGSTHSPTHNTQDRSSTHQPMPYSSSNYHHYHHHRQYPTEPGRYSSVSSGDSGFISQDLVYHPRHLPITNSPHHLIHKGGNGGGGTENQSEGSNTNSSPSSNSSTPSSPYPPGSIAPTTTATWPNLQDSIQFERAACAIMNDRPHTISSAYERGHQRPPLTVYTFQPPPPSDGFAHPTPVSTPTVDPQAEGIIYQGASEIYGILRGKKENKPPVPKRCSSLERPINNSEEDTTTVMGPPPPRTKTSIVGKRKDSSSSVKAVPVLPDFNEAAADMIVPQPVYVNMHELNQMASAKLLRQQQQMELPPPPPEFMLHGTKIEGVVDCNLKGDGVMMMMMMGGDDPGHAGCQYPYGPSPSMSSSSGSNSNSSTLTGATSQSTVSSGSTIGPTPDEDLFNPESVFSCNCVEIALAANGYYTLPRKISHVGNCPISQSRASRWSSSFRPEVYGYLGRQGSRHSISSQSSEKPPPPVRRTSSISIGHSPPRNSTITQTGTPSQSGFMNHSSFNVAQSIGPQSLNNGYQSSGEATPHTSSMEHLPPPPSYLMGQAESRQLSSGVDETDDPALKRMSVAETIKTLTEKNHQPVSPHMIRRSLSLKQAGEEKSYTGQAFSPPKGNPTVNNWNSHKSVSHRSRNSPKERGNLIQVLSEKLCVTPPQSHPYAIYGQQPQSQGYQYPSPGQQQPIYHQIVQIQNSSPMSNYSQSANNSPRHPRRFSEELIKTTATFVQSRVLGNGSPKPTPPPPVVASKEMFVQTLNAKLSQMRVGSPPNDRRGSVPVVATGSYPKSSPGGSSFASKFVATVGGHHHHHHHSKGNAVGDAAFRVRQWISSKTIPDPSTVRESLMDQIRRGTKLRQTRAVNDRSAPKFHH